MLIFGDPAYYSRFGFEPAEKFGIRTREGKFVPALLARELVPGALKDAAGRFAEAPLFDIDMNAVEAYDAFFQPMKKLSGTPSQKRFEEFQAATHE